MSPAHRLPSGKLLLTKWIKTLRPGATVTVTVTAPGQPKAVTTVKVRSGKKPTITKR